MGFDSKSPAKKKEPEVVEMVFDAKQEGPAHARTIVVEEIVDQNEIVPELSDDGSSFRTDSINSVGDNDTSQVAVRETVQKQKTSV